MTRLHIACVRPGFIRGGRPHPQAAEYELTDFTAAQLREMLAEPALSLVVGERLAERHIEAMEISFGKAIAAKKARP